MANFENLTSLPGPLPDLPSSLGPPGGPPGGLPGGPPGGLPPLPTMDMDAYIDASFFDAFEFIVNGVIINILSVVGSVGNILCIYILYLHGFEKSTNIILVSLAVADLLILLTMPLRKVSVIIERFDKPLAITVESYVVCYHFLTLNRVWALTSNAHVTLIAIERFLAVYFPFKVSRWSTPLRVFIVIIALHIVFYIVLFPMFTMFKLLWVFDTNLNETIALAGITEFYLSKEEDFNFYNSYIVNLLLGALFLSTTLVCCIGIVIRLLALSRKRKLMTNPTLVVDASSSAISNSTKEVMESAFDPSVTKENQSSISVKKEAQLGRQGGNNMPPSANNFNKQQPKISVKESASKIDFKAVKMLLVVCFVYLILIFPSFLFFVFQAVYEELKEPYWRRVNFLATTVCMLFIALNSSLNFIIYIVNSKKFYGTFRSIIRRRRDIKYNIPN